MSFAFWESLCIYGLNITESQIPTDILLVPEARRLEVAVSKRYARASPEAYDESQADDEIPTIHDE